MTHGKGFRDFEIASKVFDVTTFKVPFATPIDVLDVFWSLFILYSKSGNNWANFVIIMILKITQSNAKSDCIRFNLIDNRTFHFVSSKRRHSKGFYSHGLSIANENYTVCCSAWNMVYLIYNTLLTYHSAFFWKTKTHLFAILDRNRNYVEFSLWKRPRCQSLSGNSTQQHDKSHQFREHAKNL